MSVKTIRGDITKATNCIIVQSVNARGVMASGVALAIRKKYPQVYIDYRRLFLTTKPQFMLGATVTTYVTDNVIILSGVGQFNYGKDESVRYTDYDAIRTIFRRANELALQSKLPLVFPMIGAGLGGGDWKVIKQIIEEVVSPEVEKILYLFKE